MSAGVAGATLRRPSAIVGVAVLASFTANLDLSIVNLALPVVGEAFGVGQSTLAWTVSAYVLPFAVSILAVGRLGDRYGHRSVITLGGLLFAAGALASAIAPSYPVLLAGRVAQGIGGAALLTIGLATISATFQGPARGRALGFYFAAGAIAAVVGPLVGGLLTGLVGWPGIFWAQVPLALLVAVAAWSVMPHGAAGRHRPLDGPGLVLASLILLGINGALLQGDVWGWTSAAVIGGLALAVVALIAFVWRERTTPEPAIHLEVFRSRAFVASTLVGAAAWFGILSGSVQLAVYLQEVRGLSPTQTALVLLPWPLLAGVLFPRAASIVARIGAARTMVWSLVFALAAALLMATFDAATPLVVVSAVAALGGVPIALGVVASTVTALSGFQPQDAGIAAGVFNSLRQVGSALGVAIPAAAFDLALAPGATDVMPGSHAAFVSRAVVFALALGAVWLLLRRPLAVPAGEGAAPRPATEPAADSA
jgi:EmrB/QacA subfamily drug resistance transporter